VKLGKRQLGGVVDIILRHLAPDETWPVCRIRSGALALAFARRNYSKAKRERKDREERETKCFERWLRDTSLGDPAGAGEIFTKLLVPAGVKMPTVQDCLCQVPPSWLREAMRYDWEAERERDVRTGLEAGATMLVPVGVKMPGAHGCPCQDLVHVPTSWPSEAMWHARTLTRN
jgi:hypothetical protein